MATDWQNQPTALDARGRVVAALKRHGGAITHPTGFAGAILQREVGTGRSVTELLARMERDGMIVREIKGRRTYAITLVDDKGLAPDVRPTNMPPLMPTVEDVIESTPGEAVPADSQTEEIAARLLELVVRKASERVPDTRDIVRLQQEVARIREERDDARQTVAKLMSELAAAQEQIRLIQHNLDTLTKQRTAGERAGTPIAERLDPKTKRQLAALASRLDQKAN